MCWQRFWHRRCSTRGAGGRIGYPHWGVGAMRPSTRRLLVGGLIVSGLMIFPVPRARSQDAGQSTWARLPGGTAWVLVGFIDVATGEWGTVHRFAARVAHRPRNRAACQLHCAASA